MWFFSCFTVKLGSKWTYTGRSREFHVFLSAKVKKRGKDRLKISGADPDEQTDGQASPATKAEYAEEDQAHGRYY